VEIASYDFVNEFYYFSNLGKFCFMPSRIFLLNAVNWYVFFYRLTSKKCWFASGLGIRIDSIRIRIQQLSSIRIRIHKVIESGPNPDPDTDPDPQLYFKSKFFQRFENEHVKDISSLYRYLSVVKILTEKVPVLIFRHFLALGSGSGIRIPNVDPDPQSY
jgi:hypothetical protein